MGVFGALFLAMSAAAPAAAADAPSKPWDAEENCVWWLSADDGQSLRASIGPGDEGLVLSLADPAFLAFRQDDSPKVELIFNGDPRRRVKVEGWSSHIGKENAIFGLELKGPDLRKLAGATRLELRQGDHTYLKLPLAATPGIAALKACLPRPGHRSEEE